MKRLVILMLIALTTTLLPACKKYEDGPYISFVSRKERVVNAWKIDKVYKNDEEITEAYKNEYPNLVWIFSGNGDVVKTYDLLGISNSTTGRWGLRSDDEELYYTLNSTLGIEDEYIWTIQKLMQDSFWVTYVEGKDTFEFRFISAK